MSTRIQKQTRLKKVGSWRYTLPLAAIAATWLISAAPSGAVDIQTITLGTESDLTDTTANSITYRTKSQSITGFTTGTGTNRMRWGLVGGTAPQTSLRRSGAAPNDGPDTPPTRVVNNRQIVWGRREGTSGSVVLPPQPSTTQAALDQNNIYQGTDNLFTNATNGQGNHSDVERLDVIFGSSVNANEQKAIVIFERGVTDAHDGFKIAAITAAPSADPTQYTYGNLVTTYRNAGSWGTPSLTNTQNYLVLNNTGTGGAFTNSSTVSQDIGGVLISLTQLATAGTPIYGYSLFAADVTATNSTQLGNYNNATFFPTGTQDGPGGLDLVAADLGVVEQVPFEFSPSLGLLLLGTVWGVPSLWQRYCLKTIKDSLRCKSRISLTIDSNILKLTLASQSTFTGGKNAGKTA